MHLRTCQLRFAELVRLLNWLHGQQVLTLGQLTTGHCQAYLVHRRGRECRAVTQIYPAHAAPSGPAEPGRGMKPARGTRRHGTSFSTGGTPAMTSTSEPQDPGQHAQADSPGDIPAERPAWLDRLDVLTGQWEMEASFEAGYFGDGREWKHDFGLTYLKVD